MTEVVQPATLVQLAKRVRAILQVADAFGLELVADHLNQALMALGDCEGAGAIRPEPSPESIMSPASPPSR